MDVQQITAMKPYGDFKYFFWFGCVVSDYEIMFPTRRLATADVLAALMYVYSVCKIRFHTKLERFLTDNFSTFKEQHHVATFKRETGVNMDFFPPHRHHWNNSENIIHARKRDIRKRLMLLRGVRVNG